MSWATVPSVWGQQSSSLRPTAPASRGTLSPHLGPLVLTSWAPNPHNWGPHSPCLGLQVPTSGDPRSKRLGGPLPSSLGPPVLRSRGPIVPTSGGAAVLISGSTTPQVWGACGPHVWGPVVPRLGAPGPHVSGRCLEGAALSGGGLGMTSGSLIKWIWFLSGNPSLCSPGAGHILATI